MINCIIKNNIYKIKNSGYNKYFFMHSHWEAIKYNHNKIKLHRQPMHQLLPPKICWTIHHKEIPPDSYITLYWLLGSYKQHRSAQFTKLVLKIYYTTKQKQSLLKADKTVKRARDYRYIYTHSTLPIYWH